MNSMTDWKVTIRHIMFMMDSQGGMVFYEAAAERVLNAMIKNGKIHRHGEYYIVNEEHRS